MLESDVATFWESHPCGDASVGGLVDTYDRDYEAFFTDYDKARYAVESHIPACLDDLQVAGKRVLEIGLGQGAESEQLIRRGAIWSGLDVTAEAVSRVRTRLEQRDLPFSDIRQGSATAIRFPDDQFDLVFSHGVLHHIPDIRGAQRDRPSPEAGRSAGGHALRPALPQLPSVDPDHSPGCAARRLAASSSYPLGNAG